MTTNISVLVLGAVLAFSMAPGAWARGGGAGGAGGRVLRVQVPVEIQLVVLEGEVHLMPHRRI